MAPPRQGHSRLLLTAKTSNGATYKDSAETSRARATPPFFVGFPIFLILPLQLFQVLLSGARPDFSPPSILLLPPPPPSSSSFLPGRCLRALLQAVDEFATARRQFPVKFP
ncbi:Hypothetical protein NTJ_10744 [Nesidiocoris tenuis]|uniref:Uncharacterized protein n=1 Tax=Nesidiocoris tenuis TaxID=355587 RepID=A0ABN7B0I3_9HEMI|nr:Hypothetical protein NTJ_10744 [Nesidiocoris tenuis]